MPIPTPFFTKTSALNKSYEWRDWSGYLVAGTYEPTYDWEYYAIRNAAALFDISPLYKYEISGPDALRLVNRIVTRNVARCDMGQVLYTPWCDEAGNLLDDGTVARLAEDRFRITAADPNLRWFQDCGFGLEAEVVDVSAELAALALQGPHARSILGEVAPGSHLDSLAYFWLTETRVDDFPLTITRTGYTGDLGYELWVAPPYAERLWEMLMEKGHGYGISPAGMVVLDLARIEAGLLLIEVDYISARKALIEDQKSSPFEIGLGWTVALEKESFVGRRALLAEQQAGSRWQFVGLELHWPSLEKLFAAVNLPPLVAGRPSRTAVPLYNSRGSQIGQATSHTFSPILKKYIALATVESQYAAPGSRVDMEITVEYVRQRCPATVVKTPFFNPDRKRA